MRPSAEIESDNTLSLTSVRPTYQTIDTAPITIVDTSGVWKRGWIRPKIAGIAFWRAIDRLVRAVGRIVVWVEADADVSTAMISSLSSPEPSTPLPIGANTSSALLVSVSGPANATAAVLTST